MTYAYYDKGIVEVFEAQSRYEALQHVLKRYHEGYTDFRFCELQTPEDARPTPEMLEFAFGKGAVRRDVKP